MRNRGGVWPRGTVAPAEPGVSADVSKSADQFESADLRVSSGWDASARVLSSPCSRSDDSIYIRYWPSLRCHPVGPANILYFRTASTAKSEREMSY